jgi:LCP family protein required for cell wall assembly
MDDLRMLRDLGGQLEHEPPATLARQRHRLLHARPRRRRVTWLMAGLVAAATAVAVAVPTAVLHSRQTASVAARPELDVSRAMNVLLIGSDGRQGPNAKYGPRMSRQPDGGGRRSDTMVLLHLPADRGPAKAVQIPRDSMVEIPPCGSQPARKDMINSAYNSGGIRCAVATVEKNTGLNIDHTVEVDFTGFKDMVDALGGIEVKLPKPVDDRKSKLKLPAGTSHLDGEQALGYVRLRDYGDGSDLQRIHRQQQLLAAIIRKARTKLTDPVGVRDFLAALSGSVTSDLDPGTMIDIVLTMEKSKMIMYTVPWRPSPQDPNRLVWRPEAADLFRSLK